MPRDLRIKRLPFTRLEAERIIAIAPPGAAMKALDFQASRATATSDQLGQYRYIHFATHGLVTAPRPECALDFPSPPRHKRRMQPGRVLVLFCLSLSCGLSLHAADKKEPRIDVILWFDTEDYLLPADDDAAKRLAEMLVQEATAGHAMQRSCRLRTSGPS